MGLKGESVSDPGKRLDELVEEWKREPSPGAFSVSELRCLLESFAPLRELIRDIVISKSPNCSATEQPLESCNEYAVELESTRRALEQAQIECRKALDDVHQCNATVKELEQSNQTYRQKIETLQGECERLSAQLQQSRDELVDAQARSSAIAELALLRADMQLVSELGLGNLPDADTPALIQVVAVLAQRDSLERLWAALKTRCDANSRPASEDERTLLTAALAWHNHNWPTRPYRLIEADPNSAYRYEHHLRSRHTPTGETVVELYLPGIVDDGGRPLCKALVRTG